MLNFVELMGAHGEGISLQPGPEILAIFPANASTQSQVFIQNVGLLDLATSTHDTYRALGGADSLPHLRMVTKSVSEDLYLFPPIVQGVFDVRDQKTGQRLLGKCVVVTKVGTKTLVNGVRHEILAEILGQDKADDNGQAPEEPKTLRIVEP